MNLESIIYTFQNHESIQGIKLANFHSKSSLKFNSVSEMVGQNGWSIALAKSLSVRLRTKWFLVRVQLQSLSVSELDINKETLNLSSQKRYQKR